MLFIAKLLSKFLISEEGFADFQSTGAVTSPPDGVPPSSSFGDFSSPVEPVGPSANPQTGLRPAISKYFLPYLRFFVLSDMCTVNSVREGQLAWCLTLNTLK